MSALARLTRHWRRRVLIIIALTCAISLAYTTLESTAFADAVRQEALLHEAMDERRAVPGGLLVVVASLVKLVVMMLVPALLVIFIPRIFGAVLKR